MAISAQAPDIQGERQSGQDVRTQNMMPCPAVANIVKSSLGPVVLDKMLVDDIGDVTITNDGARILKMLEVEHPAAKVLVELAELQDREINTWKDRRKARAGVRVLNAVAAFAAAEELVGEANVAAHATNSLKIHHCRRLRGGGERLKMKREAAEKSDDFKVGV
ncbi:hypothetical protein SLE2022_026000 [Rubroshorea leprosula]